MKKICLLGCGLLLLLLSACKGNGNAEAPATSMTGNDRDEHGCIGSAGYLWSQALERCIRPFEDGIKLLPTEKQEGQSAVYAAFAVFPADSLHAELFLPKEGNVVLDRRKLPSGGYAWNQEDDDTYNLRHDADGKWIVERRAKVLFRQE